MNRHLTPGCKTVILINGIPASGKSTVTDSYRQRLICRSRPSTVLKSRLWRALPGSTGPSTGSWAAPRMKLSGRSSASRRQAVSGLLTPGLAFNRATRYSSCCNTRALKKCWRSGTTSRLSLRCRAMPAGCRIVSRGTGRYLPELAQLAQQAEPMRLGPVFTVDQHKPLDMASATRWIETQIA